MVQHVEPLDAHNFRRREYNRAYSEARVSIFQLAFGPHNQRSAGYPDWSF